MTIPSVDTFLSQLNMLNGFAKAERFNVLVLPPNLTSLYSYGSIELTGMCHATELPGRNFDTIQYRTYGPAKRMPHQTVYQDISLTFYCSNVFLEKRFFELWMDAIQSPSNWDMKYKSQFATSIIITQFGQTAYPIYFCRLVNAFPISMNPMQLNWRDDAVHKLTVNFAYDRWSSDTSFISSLATADISNVTGSLGSFLSNTISPRSVGENFSSGESWGSGSLDDAGVAGSEGYIDGVRSADGVATIETEPLTDLPGLDGGTGSSIGDGLEGQPARNGEGQIIEIVPRS